MSLEVVAVWSTRLNSEELDF